MSSTFARLTASSRRAFHIASEFGNVAKTFFQAFDQAAVKRRSCGSEPIIGPEALLSFHYQTGSEQVGQMAGSFGLRHTCDGHDIADAHFAFQKQVQDAQPSAVGESAEHEIESWFGHELYSAKRI